MTTGHATILRADARALPLPDASVDLIVTSPPYWALRSYTDDGAHYDGQIGSEDSPTEWLDAMVECTRDWMRCLKPTGSIWVNLGDKYSSPGGHTDNTASSRLQGRPNLRKQGRPDRSTATHGVAAKSLFGLPWRYAIRCIDELGLTLRAEVIWSKPNGLPESVTDRARRSHEQWFHFTKLPRYYSAVDRIRQPYAAKTYTVGTVPRRSDDGSAGDRRNKWHADNAVTPADMLNPLGAMPGSVWEIPTEPLSVPSHLGVDHFAAFPTELPRRIIQGWSPAAVCSMCGEGRHPVAKVTSVEDRKGRAQGRAGDSLAKAHGPDGRSGERYRSIVAITSEACGCPDSDATATPGVVLDPFGGTGTTALVAKALGRHGISVDRSADYCRLATWRVNDPGQIAKAMRVPAPPKETEGQGDLFSQDWGAA